MKINIRAEMLDFAPRSTETMLNESMMASVLAIGTISKDLIDGQRRHCHPLLQLRTLSATGS
jgi:hypothetical protein